MDEYETPNRATWDCKYHVVFTPKCRRKTIYASSHPHLGEVFKRLAQQRETKVLEEHLTPGRVDMPLSIPPKYAVSQVVGYVKGKSAIHLARSTTSNCAISQGSTSGRVGISSTR